MNESKLEVRLYAGEGCVGYNARIGFSKAPAASKIASAVFGFEERYFQNARLEERGGITRLVDPSGALSSANRTDGVIQPWMVWRSPLKDAVTANLADHRERMVDLAAEYDQYLSKVYISGARKDFESVLDCSHSISLVGEWLDSRIVDRLKSFDFKSLDMALKTPLIDISKAVKDSLMVHCTTRPRSSLFQDVAVLYSFAHIDEQVFAKRFCETARLRRD